MSSFWFGSQTVFEYIEGSDQCHVGFEHEYKLWRMKPRDLLADDVMLLMWVDQDRLLVMHTPR